MNLETAFIMQDPNRNISRSIKRDLAKSCNSQESSKLHYGLGEWEMEDFVDSLLTKEVSLSL
jgi:hypothetical protein